MATSEVKTTTATLPKVVGQEHNTRLQSNKQKLAEVPQAEDSYCCLSFCVLADGVSDVTGACRKYLTPCQPDSQPW